MTERENLLHVLKKTGHAKWAPIQSDCTLTLIPSPVGDRPEPGIDGYDWFGCHWTYDKIIQGFAQTPGHPLPLTDLSKWREQIVFPDLDMLDWETGTKRDLEGFDREDKALFIFTDSGPFERFFQLYGIAETYIALYEEPELFLEVMDALADFRIRLYNKFAEYYKPDIILTMDDLGSSRGPLMSLDCYRKFIKPFDKRVVQSIKNNDIFVLYHSCGCMEAFIGDLIEIGVDMINPLQGGINDQEKAEATYGDKVIFCGGLDNIVQLENITEDKLRDEMRRVLNLFWKKKNILVQIHTVIQKNTDILLDEARKYNSELVDIK